MHRIFSRFGFIGALLGFGATAKAQQHTGSCGLGCVDTITHTGIGYPSGLHGAPDVWQQEDNGNVFIGKSKPKNNQCPVCGTMAEPFEPYPPIDKNRASAATIARCKRCNAAFWQDTE